MIIIQRILACVICLVVLGILFPNLGRYDHETIRYGWKDALWICIVIAPLGMIIWGGMKRSNVVEGIGWVIMMIFLLLIFASNYRR
jgi:hypothetical protein